MIVSRDPRPGDYVSFNRDVTEPAGFFATRVVATAGQLGVVHATSGGLLAPLTVTLVLIGDGREVRVPGAHLNTYDQYPQRQVVTVG